MMQVRQEISQEYEQVKDITNTLASFKTDNSRPSLPNSPFDDESRHDRRYQHYEEPTRDPDVWPPPTPVEHK